MTPLNQAAQDYAKRQQTSRAAATGEWLSRTAQLAVISAFEAGAQYAREAERHFSSPSKLPPVQCRILINHPELGVVEVTRPKYVASAGDSLEYETPGGVRLKGRYPWTYP